MKTTGLMAMALAVIVAAGCRQAQTPSDSPAQDGAVEVAFAGFEDTMHLATQPLTDEQRTKLAQRESYFDRKAKEGTAATAPARRAAPKAAKKEPAPEAETIYVETDGAQGRVWGHVTMRGDNGTGTIHDWDENTLSVSVTRHGNELFAVDQNSRLYVFKLK